MDPDILLNPPELIIESKEGRESSPSYPPMECPSSVVIVTPTATPMGSPPPFTPSAPLQAIDQNQNRLKCSSKESLEDSALKFYPSSERDLDGLKNIRKVYISRSTPPSNHESQFNYKVTDESGSQIFETVQSPPSGSIWRRFFRQSQSVLHLQDKGRRGILKLDFGKSRTISCCQTLRFAALTAHFKSVNEEPLAVIFKDRGCCIYSCCSSAVTYENVPQIDAIHPFTVKTHRHWKNRTEFMVKHSNGSILAFIDKEKTFYTLTMGENLKPTMKACLIGFVLTMDIMDREDTGGLNCYLRPSTYVTILFLLMLFLMIGAFLYHFITAMVLAWPRTDRMGGTGCSDAVHDHGDNFPPEETNRVEEQGAWNYTTSTENPPLTTTHPY